MALPIWRPHFPDSIDGEPLASRLNDVYGAFPYDRLPENIWLSLFLCPEGMLALIALYFVSKPIFKALGAFVNPKAGWFIASVAIHNFALALFSAIVVANTWPIVLLHVQKYGWGATYCDSNGTLWGEAGFGAWEFIFYISKFYEFVDTWALLLKGKKPSFLQLYHHTGIVLGMWIGIVSHSPWLKYVTLVNSVIHSFMYTYFLIKTIDPKIEIKVAQITQLFIVITSSFPLMFLGDACSNELSRVGLFFFQFYLYGLVVLFGSFAKKKYKKMI